MPNAVKSNKNKKVKKATPKTLTHSKSHNNEKSKLTSHSNQDKNKQSKPINKKEKQPKLNSISPELKKDLIKLMITSILVLTTLALIAYIFFDKLLAFCLSTGGVLIGYGLYILFIKLKKTTPQKLVSMFIYLMLFFGAILAIMKVTGVISYLSSTEKLKELVQKAGVYAPLAFIAISTFQVIVSPIPGIVSVTVGALVFGATLGFVYSSIGIILGSVIAFFMGRLLSNKFIQKFVGKEDFIKYRKVINKKGKFLLPVMFLLPVFPDDIICIIAGVSSMKFLYFLIVTLITRPISILVSSFLMSGEIIPFRGYWWFLWAGLIILMCVLFFVLIKYQQQIEDFLTKIFHKTSNKMKKVFAKKKKDKAEKKDKSTKKPHIENKKTDHKSKESPKQSKIHNKTKPKTKIKKK